MEEDTKGMAVILAAAMSMQSLPAYASDVDAEVEIESVEYEEEIDSLADIEAANEEYTDVIPVETENDVQTELDENTEVVDEETESDEELEVDDQTEIEEILLGEEEASIAFADGEATVSVDARAAEIVDYGTCSDGLTWTLDSEGVLRIEGTGELTRDDIYSSKQKTDISSWRDLKNYTNFDVINVDCPNVTSIGDDAFRACESLNSINCPNVTTIGKSAFYYCESLNNIVVSKVESIGNDAFRGCSGITSIEMPKVTTIGDYAFIACESLNSINCLNVTTIGKSAFSWCESLNSIDCPNAITIGDDAFAYCESLNNIVVSKVENIGNDAFRGCSGITSIEMPKVKTIGEWAFHSCTSLEEINIPEGVTEISRGAFYDTKKLAKITLPDSLEIIDAYAFYNSSFFYLEIPGNVKKIGEEAFYGGSNTAQLIIFKGEYPENGIDETAFKHRLVLAFVNGESWTSHFKDTYGGTIDWRTGNPVVSDVMCVYGNEKNSRTSYSILGADGTLAIYGNGHVTKNELDDKSVIKKVEFVERPYAIESYAFSNCVSLESIEIPDNVRYMGDYVFSGCTSLQKVHLPEKLIVARDAGYQCRYMFEGDRKLTEVNIPLSLTEIPDGMFRVCSSLTAITLGENITEIGLYAFASTGLEEIILPEGVQKIYNQAFCDCKKLKKIVFPSTLTRIGDRAFSEVIPRLVIFRGEAPNMDLLAFDRVNSSAREFYYPVSAEWSNSKVSLLQTWGRGRSYDRMIPGTYHYNNDETCISDGTETAECLCECGQTDTRTVVGTKNPDKHTYTDHFETLPDGSKNYYCDLCGKPQIEAEESGECGEALTWKIYNSNMLLISGTGDMFNYDDDNPAPWSGKKIKSCKIAKGVTSIGYAAFQDCTDLTDISMEEGIKTISGYAFYGCTSLKGVRLPESVYSIGEVAFGNCTSLEKLTASEGVNWIEDNSFRKCDALTIYGYIGSSIYEFANKKGIAFESLGYWGTCGDDLEWRLIGEELTISGESTVMLDYTPQEKAPWSGLNVKHCTVTEGVKNIGNYAFYGCTSLTEIELPTTIQDIGKNAFEGCSNLSGIELPGTIKEIQESTFADCTSLRKIELPNEVAVIGESAFEGCTGLTEIEILNGVTKIHNRTFAECTSLQNVNYAGKITEIGEEAFKGCISLVTFAIPDSITEIKKGTFDGCALTTVQLPTSLKTIESRAFAGNSFTEIEIPASVTAINQQAFVECKQFQTYVVVDGNSSYSSSKGLLYNKTGAILISCPAGKTGSVSVSSKVKTIGDYAFSDCKKITELNLPTTLSAIGSYAFANMTLSEMEIPADVTSIGLYAFKGCQQLMSIDVDTENTVFASVNGILCNQAKTSVVICPPGLKKVTLWEGLTAIGAGAFAGMQEGTVIDLPFSVESISSQNDFGTAPVFRIYENAIIKWHLQSLGYKWESKGRYSVSWDDGKSYHMEMAYMQLRSALSEMPNGTYSVPSSGISYKLQLNNDKIDYEYTVRYRDEAETTIYFQIGRNGVVDNEYLMTYQTLGIRDLGYNAVLYKSQDTFKIADQTTYSWRFYNLHGITTPGSNANELSSSTLNMALAYLPVCLSDCGKLQMKDIGFTSYVDIDTIHTVVSGGGKTPTCTETGKADDKWCSICGALHSEGQTIPATGHKEEPIPAKAATCTEKGWTAGEKCSVCDKILEPTQTIKATGHKEEPIPAKAATCTEKGWTAGKKCSVCDKILEAPEQTIPATGHKEEPIPAKAATCTENGLTEGIKCSVCSKILQKQQKAADALGHQYGAYKVTSEATVLANGTKVRTCSVCGKKESVSIAKLTPTIKLNATSITLKVKQSTTKVTVSGLAKGDKVASWRSSNTKIVTVNNAGKITAQKKTGSAVLTVTLKSGKQATVKVKVQKSDVKTTSISGLPKNITLKVKGKMTLKPVLWPITSVQKISYKTSSKSIASVSSKGVITAKKPGKAKITVKAGSKKFVVTVVVTK